jgi:hypothetical protein
MILNLLLFYCCFKLTRTFLPSLDDEDAGKSSSYWNLGPQRLFVPANALVLLWHRWLSVGLVYGSVLDSRMADGHYDLPHLPWVV